MSLDEQTTLLAKYQTGLFTALAGLLIARGAFEKKELAATLGIVASKTDDANLRGLYEILISTLAVKPEGP